MTNPVKPVRRSTLHNSPITKTSAPTAIARKKHREHRRVEAVAKDRSDEGRARRRSVRRDRSAPTSERRVRPAGQPRRSLRWRCAGRSRRSARSRRRSRPRRPTRRSPSPSPKLCAPIPIAMIAASTIGFSACEAARRVRWVAALPRPTKPISKTGDKNEHLRNRETPPAPACQALTPLRDREDRVLRDLDDEIEQESRLRAR